MKTSAGTITTRFYDDGCAKGIQILLDDNIVATNSISKREFNLLSEYSKKIIVISDFLKSLIAPKLRPV